MFIPDHVVGPEIMHTSSTTQNQQGDLCIYAFICNSNKEKSHGYEREAEWGGEAWEGLEGKEREDNIIVLLFKNKN